MKDWLKYFKSHSDFILADISTGIQAMEIACNVQCIINSGEMLSVAQVVSRCSDHLDVAQAFNYDDWNGKTEQLIESHVDMLEGIPKHALSMVSANRSDFIRFFQARQQSSEVKACVAHIGKLLNELDRD